jgi:site-specific DNA-methyltransferase (adenine-specific)
MPRSEAILGDCLDFMRTVPDKYFELAIVDPPYGLDIAKTGSLGRDKFEPKNWDSAIPGDEYFIELKRVSINQVIWGGNYFPSLWANGCKEFIFWNKLNHHDNRGDGELAWTSFNGLPKYYEYMWDGNRYGVKGNILGVGMPTIRIHPTEKPVALYKWLLRNYAKEGDKIFDSHLGSQSSRIACWDGGFDFVGCELDPDYYRDGCKRFENHIKQLDLFR